MPQYRRCYQDGGLFFLTVVVARRFPLFDDPDNVARLRRAVVTVKRELPFQIHGAVILPDHMHFLWELPKDDTAYSKRMGRIKVVLTQSLARRRVRPAPSKQRHRESGVWQRRFWEHTIRNDADYQRHLDYIHYNPIKHGLVSCAHAWPYSSFAACVRAGLYAPDWCCQCHGNKMEPPNFDEIEDHTGE